MWEWEDDPHAYAAEEWFCPGCSQLAAGRKKIEAKAPTARPGWHVGLVRRSDG